MKRRKFLKKNAILAAAPFVTSGLIAKSLSNKIIAERPFQLNYAPHFGMFKNNAGEDLLDQIQFMHDQGFRSLEDNGMKGRSKQVQNNIAKKMKRLGMEMLLGVSRGSREPAKLILMEYFHQKAKQTVALVGKGVTFDSGGISLKPGKNMDEMKFDMCGAAAVLGAMKIIGQLNPQINVIGVIAATENLPGGDAQRPGDIVTAYNGKRVEILNTDAEGRLILGDALSYVVKEFKPNAVIDLATLTGACITALGHYASGAITNNDALMEQVRKASNLSGDRVWQLPSFPEYGESIKGKYGDLQNIGVGDSGTIIGGMFLEHFVDKTPWVHLDIAGTAWNVKHIGYQPNSGATGVGVRLLADLIQNWEPIK